MKRNKQVPKARWKEEEHLFGGKTYTCSHCGSRYRSPMEFCAHCGYQMTKTKKDPVWVDEMSEYDDMF